ncbi:MAG TPA: EamA family transporter [Clostridiaceae bacterium]|nr:EamA family transporter [Clostridiaceae bacterium]
MWLVLSLLALFLWSGSDLFSKLGCQDKSEKNSPLKMVMAVGLIMGLHAGYEVVFNDVIFSWQVIWAYLPVSALYIVSMAIGYFGLRYIELSVSSPICNTSGALVVVFYMLMGVRPEGAILIGVGFTLMGIIGLSVAEYTEDEVARAERQKASNMKYHKSLLAIALPVVYSLIDAGGTFADSLILETLDEAQANVAYEFTFFSTGLIVFLVLLIRGEFKLTKSDKPKLIASIFETGGQVAYIYAIGANPIAAAPIISCYCLLTVIWGRIFLKEKLSWKHYTSIGLAITGIIVLAIFDQ